MTRFLSLIAGGLLALLPLLAGAAADLPISSIGKIVTLPGGSEATCAQFDKGQPIRLLVQGIDSGVRAVGCNEKGGTVSFRLSRPSTTTTDAAAISSAWEAMLGRPWEDSGREFKRTLEYQIRQADDGEKMHTIATGRFVLQLLTPGFAFIGVALVVATWAGLLVLGTKSALVRDPGAAPGAPLPERTFSLARMQMAWWFAIIMGTYIFLWVITGETPVIGTQALGLMGVAGVTALSSAGVDASRPATPRRSRGFVLDLLSESDGVTLHRFQMLAMTVILGVIFVVHVGSHLSMPDFDGNTLALLGISAGTYVGFKIPDRSKSADGAPAGGAAAPGSTDDPKAGYGPAPDTPPR